MIFETKIKAAELFLILKTAFLTLASNQHIRMMISKGSCDTEDMTNDAENAALSSQG